jgi:hypothetical protein
MKACRVPPKLAIDTTRALPNEGFLLGEFDPGLFVIRNAETIEDQPHAYRTCRISYRIIYFVTGCIMKVTMTNAEGSVR